MRETAVELKNFVTSLQFLSRLLGRQRNISQNRNCGAGKQLRMDYIKYAGERFSIFLSRFPADKKGVQNT